MSELLIVTQGVKGATRRLEKVHLELSARQVRAGRAAANALRKTMRHEAPTAKHVAAKRKVRHLRSSISVRQVPGGWVVGPRSPLAHLVVRGTKSRTTTVGGGGKAGHQATLAHRRQLTRNARKLAGPAFGSARALSWADGGQRMFAHSVSNGQMPKNDFVHRTVLIARGVAVGIAREVLLHDAPDPNAGG